MGDMLVAYEDDMPKDRGLKASGHCALDSGLGVGNTFAPYCRDIHIQGRKVKSGHFFHHSVCRAERVRARDFYVYHVPRCERSYPWYRPRLLPTPSMRARKWAIFRVYNAIFKVLRHVARFDACEAR